ncbi:MAG: HAD-IG family 5'-nucleotidase [Myxococcales bacterium]|nr:HAD-IG family 5'-nucleotidase [Myxococcales bacterium]MCB9549342.1 HAD-IG family 5'-nucleotidase [Myxococcales bacterium]
MDDPVTGPIDLSAILEAPPRSNPERKIYTNRNLNMARIEAVGFDMDYTLAQYHQQALDELSLRMTQKKLIENHGYSEEILAIPLDLRFIIRGLVVDKEFGHILKLDSHYIVGRCYHGYRPLAREEVASLYGSRPIRLSDPRFALVDTLFSLPEATLLAGIIEHYEAAGHALPVSYRELFDDIRQSIDEAHRDNSLKAEILADLPSYIVQDDDLGPTLHKLRSSGKKLFLLTNSEHYYTDAVMTYLLDGVLPFYQSWRDYFDMVVVSGRKPSFFTEDRPFIELTPDGHELGKATQFRSGVVHQGGNIRTLESFLGLRGDAVLYVGDHMYADILRSKKSGHWRTALVVQEMEEAIALTHSLMDDLRRINSLEDAARRLDDTLNDRGTLLQSLGRIQQLIGRLTGPESRVIESTRARAEAELEREREMLAKTLSELESLEVAVDARFNTYWGRVFRERNERSLFGAQLQHYADIYTSRVSNFLGYSPGQTFRAPRDVMPHERDY